MCCEFQNFSQAWLVHARIKEDQLESHPCARHAVVEWCVCKPRHHVCHQRRAGSPASPPAVLGQHAEHAARQDNGLFVEEVDVFAAAQHVQRAQAGRQAQQAGLVKPLQAQGVQARQPRQLLGVERVDALDVCV